MAGYDGIRASALALLRRKGQTITLTRKGEGGIYDPVTMTRAEGGDATYTLSGVPLPVSGNTRFRFGELVQADSLEVWLAAQGAETAPLIGDRLTVNGGSREISALDEYAPDGTAIAWRCLVQGV